MAFPTVAGSAETAVSTAGTNHAITLPASIGSTDVVLVLMDIGSTLASLNALANWNEVLDEAAANGLKILSYTGTGVPSNPTFVSTASTRSASIALRITGASRSVTPQIATTGTGTSATPDPPSVTPTGGTVKDYLFIVMAGMAGEEADDDTWANTPPTDYLPSPPLQIACGIAGTNLGGLLTVAHRQLNTGSAQDPGTFNVDVSAAWRTQHIIVHPMVQGAATGAIGWVGSATGTRTPKGASTGTVAWVGSATGTRSPAGSAVGTLTLAGAATGVAVHRGAATGTVAWFGAATGEAPVSPSEGSATGTVTWAGAASSASSHSGAATGTVTWAGAASGTAVRRGDTTGTVTWAGTATGAAPHYGTAAGALDLTGAATGTTLRQGTGIGTIAWVGSATGEAPVAGVSDGNAEGTITWTGAATGTTAYSGAATGSVTWSGTATGVAAVVVYIPAPERTRTIVADRRTVTVQPPRATPVADERTGMIPSDNRTLEVR